MQATEVPNPEYRVAHCIVEIDVEDIDDHDPKFDEDTYKVKIQENSPEDTYVAQVHAVDIDEVSA